MTFQVQATSSFGACFLVGSNQVRIDAGGPCRITASQAGGTGFSAASATQDLYVGPAAQAIEFRTTPPSSLPVGSIYTVVVAVDSARLATFGTGPGSTGCTVVPVASTNAGNATSSATVTATNPGSCVVTAQVPPSNTYFTPSPVITQSFVVGTPQSVAFTSAAPQDAVVGSRYTPATSGGGSGQPVVLGSATPLTCTVTGDVVTFRSSGVCTLTADQAGDSTYAPAAQANQSVVVDRASQTIAFTSTAPTAAVVGGTYTPAVRRGTSTASLSLATTTPSTCQVVGGVVTFTAAGTCAVTADQADDLNVTAAPQVTQDVTVGQAGQSLTFTSSAPVGAVLGDTYPPVVTGGLSSAPVVLGTTTPATCAVSGGTVSFTAAGTCTVTADQAGDASYTAAPRVTQDVPVGKGTQAVAFSSSAPAGAVVGGTYSPTMTAGSSSAPVVLGASGACTVAGSRVRFSGVGDCTITADQAGDSNYAAAPQVTQVVAVGKAAQTISVTTMPPEAPTTGVAYPLAAAATSGLPVMFTATGPCTVVASTGPDTGTVTLTGSGACTVTASQAGDATRLAATPVTQTYQVGATGSADLRIGVTPGSGIRAAGPQQMLVTVANTGIRDSGATTTQLVVTAPVTDAGGATRTGGLFGSSVLTWTVPNVVAGQTITYTVGVNPGPGLGVFGAITRGAVGDSTPLNNIAIGGYVWTPAPATTSSAPSVGANAVPSTSASGSAPTLPPPARTSIPVTTTPVTTTSVASSTTVAPTSTPPAP